MNTASCSELLALHRSRKVRGSVAKGHQVDAVASLYNSLKAYHVGINVTAAGGGKTRMSSIIASKLLEAGYIKNVVIVVPQMTLESTWREVVDDDKLPIVEFVAGRKRQIVITYNSLAGQKGYREVFGGLLSRRDEMVTKKSGKEKHVITFTPTKLLTDLIEEGTVFIFDEARSLVNNSSTYSAAGKAVLDALAEAMKSEVVDGRSVRRSRALLLSATMCDKKENRWDILNLLGFTRHRKPFKKHLDHITYEGYGFANCMATLSDLVLRYGSFFPDEDHPSITGLDHFLDTHEYSASLPFNGVSTVPWDSRACRSFLTDLLVKIIVPLIACKAHPITPPFTVDFKNGYYGVSEEEELMIRDALENLRLIADDEKKGDEFTWGAIQSAHKAVECAKQRMYASIVRKTLAAEPTCKVVFGVNYIDTLAFLETELADLHPLVVFGDVKPVVRQQLIAKFQEPNLNHRVILLTTATGSEGISLHDESIDGRFPRRSYVSPSYLFSKLAQFSRRTYRYGMMSAARHRIVLAKSDGGPAEMTILQNLANKSTHQRAFSHFDEADGSIPVDAVPYPGEYEDYIEE
jgi:hypothetical protein